MAATQANPFDIPPEMQAFAEKSMEQARQAFETFVAGAQRTVDTLEGQAESARQGAKDLGQKVIAFAERNIANSFEHAQKLMRAKDVDDMLRLQSEFIKSQMQILANQAKELGETTVRSTKGTTDTAH